MSLRITELDFDQIKTNLKDYLRSQDEFNSYDFEASGLSVLLDILAYNTHYDAYMANQIHNEAFLDSAIKRSSVVSRAKELDYTPKSAKAATAIVDITMNNPENLPAYLTLPKYTTFNSSIGGKTYTFVNIDSYTINQIDGQYKFSSVELKEGRPYSYSFSVVNPGPSEKYTIPNDDVDTDSITVSVQTSSTNTTTQVFSRVDMISDVNSTSNVYYIEENMFGKYDIYFGDGVLGKLLTAGNIVRVDYIITQADAANVSVNFNQIFTLSGAIGGSSATINVIQNSMGGAQRESIESIKFNAPRAYSAQARLVSVDDYVTIINNNVSNVESVFVWGGEENDPPVYGKVFISLKPYSGYSITATQKEQLKTELLKKKGILTVTPEFVDPEYLWVHLDIKVSYKKDSTTKTDGQLKQIVADSVYSYFSTEMQQFNKKFIGSRLTDRIVSSDPSLYSMQMVMRVQKRIYPSTNVSQSYKLNFLTKIHPSDVESTKFYVNMTGTPVLAYIKDVPSTMPPSYTGSGTLNVYDAETNNLIISDIGTIDYPTGIMVIPNLVISGFYSGQTDIRFTAGVQEFSNDIETARNNIIVLDDSSRDTALNRNLGLDIEMIAV